MSFKVCRKGNNAQNYMDKTAEVFSKVWLEAPIYDKDIRMAWFACPAHKMLCE